MNSAEYVGSMVSKMKAEGVSVDEAAWQTAQLTIGWPYVFGDRGCYCTPANRRVAYNRTKEGKNKDNIKDRCKNFDGSKGCGGCKWYPESKRVREFDCRGFTYWILLTVSGWKLMGSGCTKQWNDPANWKAQGEISDGIPQNVIVCVFYFEKDKSGKRTKTVAHTGLYYNGETIECSNGVQYSKTLNKKWDVWGVPACSGGDVPVSHKTIKRGSTGPDVVECQEDLIKLGYDLSPYGADGKFGAKTEAAVKAFQGVSGLKQDGIVGPATWKALDEAVGPSPEPGPDPSMYTVIIPHLDKTQAERLCTVYQDATMVAEGGE